MAAAEYFPQEIIRRKRDGKVLDPGEIQFLVQGLTDGSVSEGQVAAFAMAVFFQGMTRDEAVALTQGMTHSGTTLDWRGLGRPVLDKHSTGGVGDKVSLMLAPILAACGAAVPMISGRGLGHTGGTLDKLDSIPGYNSTPDLAGFQKVVREAGCAIIGQTAELAPADRRFYAIRDVTATVESIPLITASILSKKLAAGLGGLVMDVKVGNGAFMATLQDAEALAESIVEIAQGAGLPASALITDMNQVLGNSAGNALEVLETIEYLTGKARERRLDEVTRALAVELLITSGLALDQTEATEKVDHALTGGSAAEHFARMVGGLGGPLDLLERPEKFLPSAPVVRPVISPQPGWVAEVDTRTIGLTIMALGGGRRRADERIDPGVGLSAIAGIGAEVGPDCPLALVHAASDSAADQAAAALLAAVSLSDRAPPAGKAITAGPIRPSQ